MRPVLLRPLGIGLVVLLSFASVACTAWRAEYLAEHVQKATQEEIQQRLGHPTITRNLDGGGSEWVYHYFPNPALNYPYMWHPFGDEDCTEYVLTFDERKVLTYWNRQEC
jgi:hypothetical protein